jgi:hypothetical protein
MNPPKTSALLFLAFPFLLSYFGPTTVKQKYDLVISNVTLIDGTGKSPLGASKCFCEKWHDSKNFK